MLSFANFPLLNLHFHPCERTTRVFRVLAKMGMQRAHLKFPVLSRKYTRALAVKRSGNEWGSDDFQLESEVLEFMKNSKNPAAFPSKKELVDAGRFDLVDGIVRKGGWLCLGWDLDEENDEEGDREDGVGSLRDDGLEGGDSEDYYTRMVPSLEEDSSLSASSSGRSLEMPAEDDSGFDGILNRLERERSINLGLSIDDNTPTSNSDNRGDWVPGSSANGTDAGPKRGRKPALLGLDDANSNDFKHKLSQDKSLPDFHGSTYSIKADAWRTWSSQRAGFADMEFEAAEFSANESETKGSMDNSTVNLQVNFSDPLSGHNKQFNLHQIHSQLHHLKSELSFVLCTLRSSSTVVTPKDDEGPAEESWRLSDDYEFQENEIMSARYTLRAIRANLAVLEGKIALAIIDAKKTVEFKQKKIDDTHKAFRLLRTISIVWANSASEVLLAGSFDGWATPRKMNKSESGIFSLELKLYPGQYEVKFVVDGEWKIDPLRPIVDNGVYKNNLLIVA